MIGDGEADADAFDDGNDAGTLMMRVIDIIAIVSRNATIGNGSKNAARIQLATMTSIATRSERGRVIAAAVTASKMKRR